MKLPVFCLCLFLIVASCKKDHDPTKPPAKDTTLLVATYFYSSTDTTVPYVSRDTLFYNNLWKIDKVMRYYPGSPADSIEYSFLYYPDTTISDFTAVAYSANPPWLRRYTFLYNGDKLDNLIYYNEANELTFTFAYDNEGRLYRYNSSFTNTHGDSISLGMPYMKGTYYRNGSGALDSIVTGTFNGGRGESGKDTLYDNMVFKLNSNAALPADAIDRSYLLCLSAFPFFYLSGVDFNVFLQQFFVGNEVSLYRSGTYSGTFLFFLGADFTDRPFDFTAVLYADNQVKWMVNPIMKNRTGWAMAKLVYGKIK